MSRINTNVQSLVAQRVLGQNNLTLGQTLDRLSTGLRINRGKDDPAGLIASENLRSEIKATNAAIGNAERADQVVNIAQGLITQTANSAGLSQEEKDANQLQIDSILQSIDRIANATSFQGSKLLNGNFDYQTQNVSANVSDFRVNGAKFSGTSLDVDVLVTQSAQQGALFLSLGGSSLNFGGVGSGSFTIEVAGANGARELAFASGTTGAQIAAAINSFTDVTGVTAVASGTGVTLQAQQFGSKDFVSVSVSNDAGLTAQSSNVGVYDFSATDANTVNTTRASVYNSYGYTDKGQDIGATVNGIAATGSGKSLSINTDFLDVDITLSTSASQALASLNAFEITGGGADFQLAGQVDINGKVSLGINNVAARELGGADIGYLDQLSTGQSLNIIDGDVAKAQDVVSKAISQIASTRGRLGAFQRNVIAPTIRALGVSVENTAAAESIIRDADFASETAQLTRSQILVSASTNVLSLANQTPQNALQLLG